MKKNLLTGVATLCLLAVVLFFACKKDKSFKPRDVHAGAMAVDPCGCRLDNGQYKDTVRLPTIINTNRTLSCDTLYRLEGKTYVINNSVLTIAPGARIEGGSNINGNSLSVDAGTRTKDASRIIADSVSALIITRGSRINAVGTQMCPIVFTSAKACPGPGDWGGIVILGRAPLNRPDTTVEGASDPNPPAGVDIYYGGGGSCLGIANDNSGAMRFVRIEFAGATVSDFIGMNALTLAGVGTGTSLQFIETLGNGADGFKFLGGTVNARNLIGFGNMDDDLGFNFGYTGKVQFVVASKCPEILYLPGASGIESNNGDNGSCATCKVTLDSAAGSFVSNVTIIGKDTCNTLLANGAAFDKGSHSHLKNSLIIDYQTGVRIQSACPLMRTRSNFIHGFTVAAAPPAIESFIATYNDTLKGCHPGCGNSWVKMVNPYATGTFSGPSPNFTLQSGSPALTGANFLGLSGATVVNYRGAFGASTTAGSNWTTIWTRWDIPSCL